MIYILRSRYVQLVQWLTTRWQRLPLDVTKSTIYSLLLVTLLLGGYVHVTCGFPLYTCMVRHPVFESESLLD